jgi:FkbM family methyltransferase
MLSAAGLRPELVVRHLHRVGSVRSRLPNGRTLHLWSRADDWVSNQVFWRGWTGYEPETTPLFFRLASRARVTFDVGAYIGFYSVLAAHANPNGRVFAFEPLPSVFSRLEDNVARNHLSSIVCVRAAVGAAEGTFPLYHRGTTPLPCSSSLTVGFMRETPDLLETAVPVLRLDSFARSRAIDRVDLMKIDTESTEPDVLRGAKDLLRETRPFIVCEVLPGRGAEEPLTDILRPLGYHFYHLTPEGPQERPDVRGHAAWLNYLFTTLPGEGVRELISG